MAEIHPAKGGASLDDDGLPQLGDVIAGKYRLERIVGRGGMGIVFAAQHVTLGQSVAIKVLSLSEFDEPKRVEAVARFMREGQAAARLTSDHVVRIYDFGTLDSGQPFMVMELLRGEDAASLLSHQGTPPIEVAADYIVQACDAVGEAHKFGIVHRDLKPSNLFVSLRSDGRAHVKVLDFGISKAIPGSAFDGNLTDTRSVVGSPYYMSPEQVRDSKRVDTRTDIWSLGMILYEFLAGEPAFNADTLPGICAAIAADVPLPVGLRRPGVSAEFEAIVMRCLEKDPKRRFQSIQELASALLPFASRGGAPSHLEYVSRNLEPAGVRVNRDYPTMPLGESSGLRRSQSSGDLASASQVSPPTSAQASPRVVADGSASTLLSSSGTTLSAPEGGNAFALPDAEPAPSVLRVAASTLSSKSEDAPAREAPRARARSRRLPWFAAAAFLAAGVLWRATHQKDVAPREPTAPTPEARFELTLESEPMGAMVFENDRALGTTPLEFPVSRGDVASAPRRFVLRLDGYAPYSVEQGPSDRAVQIVAHLVKLAVPADVPVPAPSMTVPATSASAALRSRPVRHPAPRVAPPAPGKPAPPTDIRLER